MFFVVWHFEMIMAESFFSEQQQQKTGLPKLNKTKYKRKSLNVSVPKFYHIL